MQLMNECVFEASLSKSHLSLFTRPYSLASSAPYHLFGQDYKLSLLRIQAYRPNASSPLPLFRIPLPN